MQRPSSETQQVSSLSHSLTHTVQVLNITYRFGSTVNVTKLSSFALSTKELYILVSCLEDRHNTTL